jgi:hypothetical protein
MSAGPGVFADSQLVAALMAVGQLSRYLFFRVFPYYYPGKFARAAQNRRPFAVSPFRRFAVSKAFGCGCATLNIPWFRALFCALLRPFIRVIRRSFSRIFPV